MPDPTDVQLRPPGPTDVPLRPPSVDVLDDAIVEALERNGAVLRGRDRPGIDDPVDPVAPVTLTAEDLASGLGMGRETVLRSLERLGAAGRVARRRDVGSDRHGWQAVPWPRPPARPAPAGRLELVEVDPVDGDPGERILLTPAEVDRRAAAIAAQPQPPSGQSVAAWYAEALDALGRYRRSLRELAP